MNDDTKPPEAPKPVLECSLPVGVINGAPEKEDPLYYQLSTNKDGAMTLGPFDLTAQNLKSWADKVSLDDLNELVENNQIRPSTAMTVRSPMFKTIINMMAEGQKPGVDTLERFFPGDLQRVIAKEVLGK